MPGPVPRRLGYGEEATLVEHLGELRARLVISLIAIVGGTVAGYVLHARVLHWLEQVLPESRRRLVTFSVAEPFITSMWVSLYLGMLIALPIVLYQLWAFLAPAFDVRSQRVVVGLALFAGGLGALGLIFGRYVALPAATHFLTNYDSHLYDQMIRARDFVSFCTMVLVAVTVVFELPIFILALVRIGVLSSRKLRRNRRIGYALVAVLAVALPGVDPVTTVLEMIPLFLLFELSIWLSVALDQRQGRGVEATTIPDQ